MRRTVLDASAILAALFREPGADVVETHYQAGIVSAVNLSEVAVKLSDRGMPDVEARNLLSGLGLVVCPFDERLAYMAKGLGKSHALLLGYHLFSSPEIVRAWAKSLG